MRRLIRLCLRMFWTGVIALLATYATVIGWTYLWPLDRPLPRGDAIVCLGASIDDRGQLGPGSVMRAERCGDFWRAGVAPVVVFSGGVPRPGAPSAAAAMADRAGVPGAATRIEGQSHSTLQNALFSLRITGTDARLVLVTEAFHLPRSWASFRAMGARDLVLVPAGRLRPGGRGMLPRETAAIWFNAGRYILWRMTAAFLPDDIRTDLLH